MQNPIEQKANPFALNSNTNVEYDAVKWAMRGKIAEPDNWRISPGKELVWKPRKVALAEPGKYFFTGDLVPYEIVEKEKLKSLEKGASKIVQDVSSQPETQDPRPETSSPRVREQTAKDEYAEETKENGDVEALAKASGISEEEIRKNR